MNQAMMKRSYTYYEVIDEIYGEIIPHDSSIPSSLWTDIINNDLGLSYNVISLGVEYSDALIKEVINALLNVVYNRHYNDYFLSMSKSKEEWDIYDGEVDLSHLKTKDVKLAFNKLLNVIDITIPRYIPLLKQNEKYSFNPLAPNEDSYTDTFDGNASSSSSGNATGHSRFNDTPQNGGMYEDDAYTTNINESSSNSSDSSSQQTSNTATHTSKQNIGNVMQRLTEMFTNWRAIIRDWSDEFNVLFFKEEQL